MVEQVVECVAAMAGVACPLPAPDLRPWGASVVHTLTVGVDGWAMHEPLRTGGRRSAAVLDRVEAVGADADPAWFPTDGLVHLDLHTDNILAGDDGTLTGIIDWEGACAGDPRFDLVRLGACAICQLRPIHPLDPPIVCLVRRRLEARKTTVQGSPARRSDEFRRLDQSTSGIETNRRCGRAKTVDQARGMRPPRAAGAGKGGHHDSHINHHRGGRYTMNAPASITITPVRVADLLAEGERMPVYVHVIDHPDARVLVDTGMTELHPAVADLDPRLRPLSKQDFDLAGIDIVVNTHLHFDHCGGNHLFAGRPIYVQRRELDDARSEDDYTIREWVEAPGVRYVPVDGELELLPGLRLVPAPGHTRGTQVVVIETGGRPVVVGGDVAVWFGELDEPHTEGQLRVRALDPELVWLAHEHEPWRPRTA